MPKETYISKDLPGQYIKDITEILIKHEVVIPVEAIRELAQYAYDNASVVLDDPQFSAETRVPE